MLVKTLDSLVYQEVDGFYVLDTENGCLYSHQLRQLADELDEMNKDWQAKIDEHHRGIE